VRPLYSANKQQYAVSADGQRFLVNLAADEGSLAHHAHLQLEAQTLTGCQGGLPYEVAPGRTNFPEKIDCSAYCHVPALSLYRTSDLSVKVVLPDRPKPAGCACW